MFQDREAVTGTGISSSWKMSVSVRESASQTLPCTRAEISCQVRETSEMPCQTDLGNNCVLDNNNHINITTTRLHCYLCNFGKINIIIVLLFAGEGSIRYYF